MKRGAVITLEEAGRWKRTLYMSFDPGCSIGCSVDDYEGFVQANRNGDRTLGIQIVGLYPNMPGFSISPRRVDTLSLFNGCTQMSSSDQPISSLVPRSATDQHALISLLCIHSCDRLGACKTSKFHELLVRREMLLRVNAYIQATVNLPDLC